MNCKTITTWYARRVKKENHRHEAVDAMKHVGVIWCACRRGVKTNTMHDDEGLPTYRQPSRSISRMFKTTRFADSPANQDAPHIALSQSMSGIPTGATAHWMLSRLMHAPGRNALLLSILAVTIITLQVSCLPG